MNFYSDVGVELIPRGSKVIAIGHPSTGFERWDSDEPVHRPLVLVTRPDTGDPDQWKPAKLDDAWRAAGIASFRAEVKPDASDLASGTRTSSLSRPIAPILAACCSPSS